MEIASIVKQTVAQTHGRIRPAPVATMLTDGTILAVPILDLTQRVLTLKAAAREHGAWAFVLAYSGAFRLPWSGEIRDAVFVVWLTKDGHGGAVAHPWHLTPDNAIEFDDPYVEDEMAQRYTGVFAADDQNFSAGGVKTT